MKSFFVKSAVGLACCSLFASGSSALAMGRSEDPREQEPQAYGTAADPDIRQSDQNLSQLLLQKSEPSLEVPVSGRRTAASAEPRS